MTDVIRRAIQVCSDEELSLSIIMMQIELPTWINRSLIILNRTDNLHDTYTDPFSVNYSPALRTALRVELSDIYQALSLQQKASRRSSLWYRGYCWMNA